MFGHLGMHHHDIPFWAFQGAAWGRYPPPTQRARPFEPFPGELEEEATAVVHFGLPGEAGDPPVRVEQDLRTGEVATSRQVAPFAAARYLLRVSVALARQGDHRAKPALDIVARAIFNDYAIHPAWSVIQRDPQRQLTYFPDFAARGIELGFTPTGNHPAFGFEWLE